MGGQHSDLQTESFKKADWTQVALKEKGEILWSHRRDANVKLVSYPIFSQSQKQFKHEKDLYYLRKNNPRLVAALALESFENQDFCSTQYKQTLFLEHIPITLSDIEHIPYPDHLHIYDQSFKGFQQLASAVGCFIVEDEHIGINEKGVVKVWLNGDFHRSFIVGCRVMQEIMVRSIVETIDKSSDEVTLPRGIPSVKNYLFRNNDTLNFENIIIEFNEYLKLYNGGKAPERLACIDRVGIHTIVDRDTQVWERQGSVLEFDRNELYQQSNTHQSGVTSQRMFPAASGYKSGTIAHQNLRNFDRRLPESTLMREVRSTQNIKLYGSPEKSNGSIPIFSQYSQFERPTLRPELIRENMTIYRKPEPLQSLPSPINAPIIKIPPPQIKPPTLSTVKSSQFLKGSQFISNPPLAAPSPAPTPIKFIQNNLISPNKSIMESPRPVVNFQSSQGILRNHQSPTGMKHSHIIQKIHYPPQTHPHFIAQNTAAPKLNSMSQSHLMSSAQPIHQVVQPANSIYTSPPVHHTRQVRTVPITVEVVPGKVSFIEKLASQTSNSQMISPQQHQAEPKKKANAQSVVSHKASVKKIHTNVPAFISKHQKTASNLSNLKEEPAKPIQEIKIVENYVDNAIAITHDKIENKLPQPPQPFSQLKQVISITESQQSHKAQVSLPEHNQIIDPVQELPISIEQPEQAKMVVEVHQQQVNSDPIEAAVDNQSEHVSFTENSREIDHHETTEQQESSLMNEAQLRSERLISQQINKSQEDYIPRPISNPNDNRNPLNSEYLEPQHLNSQLQSVQNQRMQSNINSSVGQSQHAGQIYHSEQEDNRQFIHQKEHHSQLVEATINDYQAYQTYQPKITYEVQQIERFESPDPSIAGHSMASITGGQKDDKYSLWTAGNRDYVSASLSIEPTKQIAASFNPNYTNQIYGNPDVKTQKFQLHSVNNDNNYNPFGGNNVVYSSFETAAIPTYESYESFEAKSFTDDKPAKNANIHIDDGKSSQDFLRKLREIGSGSESNANPLPSSSQTGYFNNYSSGYSNFKSGLSEDYGTSYVNNYSSSKYNYQDYQSPSYTSFAPNAYEYQPNRYIDSEPYAFQSKFSNAYEPKSTFSDDDFGKNAVSNIIPTSYVSGENSLSYGEPLKFENNIALIYSRTEEVSPTQSPNGPSSYRARYDPQILADLQNLH